MRNDLLNREATLKLVGSENLVLVDAKNAEIGQGIPDENNEIDFIASIQCKDANGGDVVVSAYYYQDADLVNERDLDDLNWECAGYLVN